MLKYFKGVPIKKFDQEVQAVVIPATIIDHERYFTFVITLCTII